MINGKNEDVAIGARQDDHLLPAGMRRGLIVQEPDGGDLVRRFRIPIPSLASNSNSTPISSSAFWMSLIVLS